METHIDIYDALEDDTEVISEISRANNGRLNKVSFDSKSGTVNFDGDTYEVSEVIDDLRKSDVFEETSFQTFQRSSLTDSEDGVGTAYLIFAYPSAIFLPIVGLGFGIYGLAKGSQHGIIVTAISLIPILLSIGSLMWLTV